MHSPLPDSSALEAGILEDETPSPLSRVQDNVRNLLRNSRFGSVQSSPLGSPTHIDHPQINRSIPTPAQSTLRRVSNQPEVVPSPSTESMTSANTSTTTTTQGDEIPGVLFPPASYGAAVQQMAHQSTLFNTRAVAALNHPDLNDPSLASFLQQKNETRQQQAWKRSKHGKRHSAATKVGSSQCLLCVLAALLLAAIVATYIVLATTSTDVDATFHILFILGIMLATIVFAHTLVRLLLFPSTTHSRRKVLILPPPIRPHHRHHGHYHHHPRRHRHRPMPSLSNDATEFVPATPIRVHMPADEIRPDTREAEPTATATAEVEPSPHGWDKDVESLPNPPPAYGRWRGSVRANPDLLHWQPVPSPVDSDAPELPSPTYDEAMAAAAQRTGPPSYVTRESPARTREVREVSVEAHGVQAQTAEPEMVEGPGIGLGI